MVLFDGILPLALLDAPPPADFQTRPAAMLARACRRATAHCTLSEEGKPPRRKVGNSLQNGVETFGLFGLAAWPAQDGCSQPGNVLRFPAYEYPSSMENQPFSSPGRVEMSEGR